ncbi:hypothetical protein jhhlp_001886 [Lomentospora prolificans]|uniref:ferric-chelate reductase (NADPH) n=1 Tax=Lomentospora prolificans TaxID=41688 RepID=A0A2N3NCE9_9PEZI|nr:hypothetical protein jhhlp_001886 [Lomentospora prolificans]
MDHSHHGSGSSTTGTGAFKKTNMALARAYWYIIAGVVGLCAVIRLIDYVQVVSRRRRCKGDYTLSPSRPTNAFSQAWATVTAICRELTYPQLHIPIRWLSWASPPPLGRIIILLAYWAVVIYMMADKAVIRDAYFWERIAFRNAWITVTQIPLVYMLAMKTNPIGLITGISHERLNWLHRWVSRTMFVTATVHGFHFWTQWVLADFVELELKIMPMVKYGLGGWAVLLWMFVTSFYPIRSIGYEVFVLQHVLSAVIFIWLMYKHLPPIAMYNVWLAVGFIAFDRAARWALIAFRNFKLKVGGAPCMGRKRVGHEAIVRTVSESTTIVTVRDAHFKWRPGQHLYLWMPTVGPTEAHPYTIACAHKIAGECVCNSVELVIRKHGGFSKRLHSAARKAQDKGELMRTTAFVYGPYGSPPSWDVYDTVILISASTGASFTLPILEDIVRSKTKTCLRRAEFILTARQSEETGFYVRQVRECLARGRHSDVELHAHVAITGPCKDSALPSKTSVIEAQASSSSSSSSSSSVNPAGEKAADDAITPRKDASTNVSDTEKAVAVEAVSSVDPAAEGEMEVVREYDCRLDMAALIRGPVEAALGETLVVVCGGRPLVARVRNCVAKLSDERAVHKGTGAQGIHLHVEEYSF